MSAEDVSAKSKALVQVAWIYYATLKAHVAEWELTTGIKVSIQAMSRAHKRFGSPSKRALALGKGMKWHANCGQTKQHPYLPNGCSSLMRAVRIWCASSASPGHAKR
jgi:hypothetical protein